MKILFFCILSLLSLHVASIHLKWNGGYAGRILMRAYSDPALQQAVKSAKTNANKNKLRELIATKIGELVQKDPTALQRLANASFPDGYIGRVNLTKQQKIKLLNISINNPQLLGETKKGEYLELVGKQDDLKNVYDQLSERRKAYLQVKEKLISKVKADPTVAPFIANGTKRSDPQFRKAFKAASAKYIKADVQLQKIVAKSRFGFDPVFSKLSDDQRVKLLNILLDSNKTQTLRWKSPEYLRAVSDAIQGESTLKEFYDKNKDDIQNKIKLAQQRKAKWLARKSSQSHLSHLETFEDMIDAGIAHLTSAQ